MLKRVNLEITYSCNLSCDFCYLKSTGKLNAPRRELGLERLKAFIDSVASPDVDLYVTGGEPFARPDCLDILEYGKARAGHCGVNTNGTLLDARAIERLARIGLDYVIFSLHGTPSVHDGSCGRGGTFSRVLENIRALSALSARGTEIMVNCVVNERNFGDLEGLFLACADAGAHRVVLGHLQFLSPREARAHAKQWRSFDSRPCRVITPIRPSIAKTDTAALSRGIERLTRRGWRGVHLDLRPGLTRSELARWYDGVPETSGRCQAAQEVLVVAPNGDVRACQLYDNVLGNVADQDWRDVWWSQDAMLFRERVSNALFPGCARCCLRFDFARCY
ncbi:MAG: hypothetical protein A2506_03965 [Elusimicrobia bacterium RIFOXYD12_FULL_66_9]|nr:MAG: hypothetical protein A2506_03965 [Elusimicrobia bacterium RIFOXYD12_FULL_66_9]